MMSQANQCGWSKHRSLVLFTFTACLGMKPNINFFICFTIMPSLLVSCGLFHVFF